MLWLLLFLFAGGVVVGSGVLGAVPVEGGGEGCGEGDAFEGFVEDAEGLWFLVLFLFLVVGWGGEAELGGVVDEPLDLPVDGLCAPVPGRLVLPLAGHALGHGDGLDVEKAQAAADMLVEGVDEGRAAVLRGPAVPLVALRLGRDVVQLVAVPDLLEQLGVVGRV